MVSQRLAGVPMETNGILAVPGDPGLTCWVSHQAPHAIHGAYAPMLGLEPAQLRVVCPWVGGGFGPKAGPYVEHLATAAAALKLGRPVKWIATRSEDMVSLVHGRDFVMTAKLGVNADGKIVGLDASVVASAGAYPGSRRDPADAHPDDVGRRLRHPQRAVPGHRTCSTNNTTVGPYRGAGRPEATQLIERVIDVAADKIGMDPAEIRRVNFIPPEQVPAHHHHRRELRLRRVREVARRRVEGIRLRRAARRAGAAPRRRTTRKQLGIGVSTYVEVTAPVGLHIEFGAVEIDDDGAASVFAGTSVHGQGHHTAFAMLASEVLGIPMDKITLVNSDTDRVPRGAGHDGFAIAADRGQRHPRRVERGARPGPPGRQPHARGVARRHRRGRRRPARGRCARRGRCRGPSWPWPRATRPSCPPASNRRRCVTSSTSTAPTPPIRSARTCRWSRSTPRPARSTMLRHVAVDDCGRILNPLLVGGQQHGGIAQGAAQALYEWMQYDDDGNPLTATLLDYSIPSAAELCSFEVSNTQTDSPRNPLGAKGIGESGTIGSTPGHPERRRRRRSATSA